MKMTLGEAMVMKRAHQTARTGGFEGGSCQIRYSRLLWLARGFEKYAPTVGESGNFCDEDVISCDALSKATINYGELSNTLKVVESKLAERIADPSAADTTH